MEEEINKAGETVTAPAAEAPAETPAKENRRRGVSLNASVDPENFDWDAFESDGEHQGAV